MANKMGRPRKTDDRKYSAYVHFRVPPPLMQIVQAGMDAMGMTLSQYARLCLMRYTKSMLREARRQRKDKLAREQGRK
jgi:hypothetical protein